MSNSIEGQNYICFNFDVCNKILEIITNLIIMYLLTIDVFRLNISFGFPNKIIFQSHNIRQTLVYYTKYTPEQEKK